MKLKSSIFLIIVFLLMSSCGPSPEQIATMTAAAWTPTPLPTPTATPMPYDMTVIVTDETGVPIQGAAILFEELKLGAVTYPTDVQGKYAWTNLKGESVTLNVTAQGYLAAHQTATIQRGPNEVQVKMQADPQGIIPSKACPDGQKVLYVEDFQDGQAQGWPSIAASLKGTMPFGFSIVDENGNKVLLETKGSSGGDELDGFTADNFVWHAKFKAIGNDANFFFMWRITHQDPDRYRYVAALGLQNKPWMIRFVDSPNGPLSQNTAGAVDRMKEGQWYDVVISYFNGVHQVWYDGKKQMEYKDSKPFPPGTIGFETHLNESTISQFYVDDLVICELTAPYEP